MKTLKIFLATLAIVGASGATLATQNSSAEIQGYIYLPPVGSDPAMCEPVQANCDGNGALCTYQDRVVRDKDDITSQCGTQLRFRTSH
jgi:hypothetical protein